MMNFLEKIRVFLFPITCDDLIGKFYLLVRLFQWTIKLAGIHSSSWGFSFPRVGSVLWREEVLPPSRHCGAALPLTGVHSKGESQEH